MDVGDVGFWDVAVVDELGCAVVDNEVVCLGLLLYFLYKCGDGDGVDLILDGTVVCVFGVEGEHGFFGVLGVEVIVEGEDVFSELLVLLLCGEGGAGVEE